MFDEKNRIRNDFMYDDSAVLNCRRYPPFRNKPRWKWRKNEQKKKISIYKERERNYRRMSHSGNGAFYCAFVIVKLSGQFWPIYVGSRVNMRYRRIHEIISCCMYRVTTFQYFEKKISSQFPSQKQLNDIYLRI